MKAGIVKLVVMPVGNVRNLSSTKSSYFRIPLMIRGTTTEDCACTTARSGSALHAILEEYCIVRVKLARRK